MFGVFYEWKDVAMKVEGSVVEEESARYNVRRGYRLNISYYMRARSRYCATNYVLA
jgi:hypothetical protein